MVMRVYLLCRLEMSGWITVDTVRGDGRGVPVTELILGRDTPGMKKNNILVC